MIAVRALPLRRPAVLAALAAACLGCPAARPSVRPPPIPLDVPAGHDEPALPGVVHVVRRGETLYRIARAYGIDPADLMETNGISDPRALAVGTELFVPGAEAPVEVPAAPAEPARPPGAGAPGGDPAPATPAAAAPPEHPSPGRAPPPPPRPASAAPGGAAERLLAWPLHGVLYGRFGVRAGQRHDGIDIAAPEGTAVGAAADGSVFYVGEQPGYGQVVILKHDSGLVTVYAHNSAVLVREGARVARGQPIARVGQSGRTSGPHLHFEVREGTRPRNPLLFLP